MTGPAVVTEQLHIEDVPSGPAIKRAVHILIGPRVRVNRAEAELWKVRHHFFAANKNAKPSAITPINNQLTGNVPGPIGLVPPLAPIAAACRGMDQPAPLPLEWLPGAAPGIDSVDPP